MKEGFISLPLCLLAINSGSLMDLNVSPCALVCPKYFLESLTILTSNDTGSVQHDWLIQAKPDIEARMAQYEEGQIEFAILSLVRDPLLEMVPALAKNVKAINQLSTRLDMVKPGWKDFIDSSTDNAIAENYNLISKPNLAYGLTQEMLDHSEVSQIVTNLCYCNVASDILGHREQLIVMQAGLRMSIREEMQSNRLDEEKAAARTCDYGARMQNFVRKMKVKKQSFKQ